MIHKIEQPRKLFIGGLSPETTDEDLNSYFSTFGNIMDVVVIKDKITKMSRRFGFVVFSTMEEIDKAQRSKPHTINGRNVDTRRSCPKDKMTERGSIDHIRRLFVYGINDKTTQQSLEDYFNPYGNLKSIDIIKDKAGALRGFAFVEYDDSDPVDKLTRMKHHTVNGQDLQVKKVFHKEQQQGVILGDSTLYSRGAPRNMYNQYRLDGRQDYNDVYRQDAYAARGIPDCRTSYSRGASRNIYNQYRPNGRRDYKDSYRQDPYAARGMRGDRTIYYRGAPRNRYNEYRLDGRQDYNDTYCQDPYLARGIPGCRTPYSRGAPRNIYNQYRLEGRQDYNDLYRQDAYAARGIPDCRTSYARGAPRNIYNQYRPNGRRDYNDSYRQDPYAARGFHQDNYSGYNNNTGCTSRTDQYRYAQRYDKPTPNYCPYEYNYDAGY